MNISLAKIVRFIIFLSLPFWGATGSPADELGDLLTGFEDEQDAGTDQPEDLDMLLTGFDSEQDTPVDQEKKGPMLPSWLEIQGGVSLQLGYNIAHDAPQTGEPDFRGFSMFRTKGELIGDLTFPGVKARIGAKGFYDALYDLRQQDEYSSQLISGYEKELELSEASIETTLSDTIDIKIGRQIVVWGKSDNIRITDILNPMDLRYPGMVDIRDLRLPVTMTKLDYYPDNWNLSSVIIHEPRFSKSPVYNSDFFPGSNPLPPTDEPSTSFDNQQYGLAANGMFKSWDLSLYTASVFADQPTLEKEDEVSTSRTYRRSYSKALMAGFAANVVYNNWLFKTEAAYWDGLKASNIEGDYSRFDLLVGVEYRGFPETTLTLELADRHIIDFDQQLSSPPDSKQEDLIQSVIRLNKDYLHDTLHLTILLSTYGISGKDGAFQRMQLDYDLNDDVSIKGAAVFYQSGDYLPLSTIGGNDRLLLEVEYRF